MFYEVQSTHKKVKGTGYIYRKSSTVVTVELFYLWKKCGFYSNTKRGFLILQKENRTPQYITIFST